MRRVDAVSLLRELMSSCASFCTAQAVSIGKDKNGNGWILNVKWVPNSFEMECVSEIAVKHCIEIATADERTVFRFLAKVP